LRAILVGCKAILIIHVRQGEAEEWAEDMVVEDMVVEDMVVEDMVVEDMVVEDMVAVVDNIGDDSQQLDS
jgi:hypothetical protein